MFGGRVSVGSLPCQVWCSVLDVGDRLSVVERVGEEGEKLIMEDFVYEEREFELSQWR